MAKCFKVVFLDHMSNHARVGSCCLGNHRVLDLTSSSMTCPCFLWVSAVNAVSVMLLDGDNMDMRSVQAFIRKEVWAVSSQES